MRACEKKLNTQERKQEQNTASRACMYRWITKQFNTTKNRNTAPKACMCPCMTKCVSPLGQVFDFILLVFV
jgi:hypothetical protein